MTTAILDTNVLVQAAFGVYWSASRQCLSALDDRRFSIVFANETLDELLRALSLDSIQSRLNWTDQEINRFVQSLLPFGEVVQIPAGQPPILVRDVSDRKFVSLAVVSGADFLVTNDRRHLRPLKFVGKTQIVSPTAFLRVLA